MSDGFLEHVLDQLGGDVTARAMFGGYGLYHAGAMFGIVYDDAVYFKVDDRTRPLYESAGSSCFAPRPRQRLTSFFDVPPEVLEDRDALEAWAAGAQDAARAGRH